MADYKPDYIQTGELLRSAGIHRTVIDAAFEAKEFAESISPVHVRDNEDASHYVENFHVDGAHTEYIADNKRAVAYLYNDSRYATAVELGWDLEHKQWADHRGYHVLGITADVIEHGSDRP